MKQIIVFKIENQSYGLDIQNINNISEYIVPTPMPNSGKFISGVINIRGEIYLVINTATLLGSKIRKDVEESRIIILDLESKVGLHVDETANVITIDEEHCQSTDQIVSIAHQELVANVINYENEIILELDVHKLTNLNLTAE